MADYQMVQNDTLVRLVTSQKQKKTLIDTYSLTLSAMGQTLGWGRLLHIYHSRSQVPSFEFKKKSHLSCSNSCSTHFCDPLLSCESSGHFKALTIAIDSNYFQTSATTLFSMRIKVNICKPKLTFHKNHGNFQFDLGLGLWINSAVFTHVLVWLHCTTAGCWSS